MALTVGTIASGIGGWDLGLERAGMRVRWQCELDPFCQRVLRRHWPDTPIYGDANAQDWTQVDPVDVLAAGYPCQPFSVAGQRAGFDDERNLWPAVARAIRDIRPRYVLLENVRGHLSMGFGHVLGDLARLGYDAEWDVLAARDFGAPHKRERVWIVAWDADDDSSRRQGRPRAERQAAMRAERERLPDAESERPESGDVGCQAHATHADRGRVREQQISKSGRVGAPLARRDGAPRSAADPNRTGREEQHPAAIANGARQPAGIPSADAADSDVSRLRDRARSGPGERPPAWGDAAYPDIGNGDQRRGHVRAWQPEPAWGGQTYAAPGRVSARWREWHAEGIPPVSPVCGMDDGVSARLDRSALARLRRQDRPEWERVIARRRQPRARLRSLGNALVPDIAEWIGRRVVAHATGKP